MHLAHITPSARTGEWLSVMTPETKPLLADLFGRPRGGRGASFVGWALALGAHALVGWIALEHHTARASVERPPVEVEIAAPPAPPPEPPAPKLAEAPHPVTPVARAAAAPPPAAQAGALHTAKEDPSEAAHADDPLDFTHDQSVQGFGGGVVAVGGKAKFGAAGAALGVAPSPSVAARVVAPRASGETLVAAGDLGRKPSLTEPNPCQGYFPNDAAVDEGSSSVLVTIAKSGAVSKVTLVSESPPGQGFGAAARTCMSRKRFTVALDREGNAAATAVRVNVRFTR